MKCSNCNSENNETAKFCRSCGAPLTGKTTNNSDKHRKIIIALVIAIIAILAIGGLYGMGIIKGETPLETQEFDGFTLDVPVGSEFRVDESITTQGSNVYFGFINYGEHSEEAGAFQVGTKLSEKIVKSTSQYVETDGDLKIYKNDTDELFYEVFKKGDDANIVIYGKDLDCLKKMAKSFKDKDFKKLASKSTPKTTSSSASSSKTPSSISILGGSFSTGSAESDKTYASINVGTAHAGENVIVQIWYSRDGATLNNGNMVPATVHSDGYLEISSADAYHYYPDYATINIYDSNSNLLTSQSVSLSPESGTQYF